MQYFVSVVSNTVLCTYKLVKSGDLTLSIPTTIFKKQLSRKGTQ